MEEKKQVTVTGEQLLEAYRAEQMKLEALQQRMQQLQGLVIEANTAEEAVNEIKKAAKNEKIIVSLGAGVYTEAVLDGNESFKTGLAGSIMQNSDTKKTLDYLKEQKEMLQKESAETAKEYEKTISALNEIGGLLQQAERQAQQRLQKAAEK
ncbi:MAG TPA: hypothetical protein VI977_03135 [archaeon]|nr:hypothetical protein [archaeon]